jgi:hypothetical protein
MAEDPTDIEKDEELDNSDSPPSRDDDHVITDWVFAQYKLAVEMLDRIRERRQKTNSFYV